MLQERQQDWQLSKIPSVCRMEIRELSPEKLCICSQYIRKIIADTQTRCKVKESLGITKGHKLKLAADQGQTVYLLLT